MRTATIRTINGDPVPENSSFPDKLMYPENDEDMSVLNLIRTEKRFDRLHRGVSNNQQFLGICQKNAYVWWLHEFEGHHFAIRSPRKCALQP